MKPKFHNVERREHGRALVDQINSIGSEVDRLESERAAAQLPPKVGLVLEIESAPGYPLSADQIHALTTGSEIQLLFATHGRTPDGKPLTRALVHVPYGQLAALAEKFRRYGEDTTEKGNTPNPWVANLQRVGRAAISSLWTEREPMPEGDDPQWWQLWVRRVDQNLEVFLRFAAAAGITVKGAPLRLPEHFIVVAQARRSQLESSLDLLNTLAEIRRARSRHYEVSDLTAEEQHDWINLAKARIQPPAADAPAVCLLDTGINRGHPLLQDLLAEADNQTIFPDGDSSDSSAHDGHGTRMAGLAAYGDLRTLLTGTGPWVQRHRLEGVKMFDDNLPHEPENYGSITTQAVQTPAIANPARRRVFSLPITADGIIDGMPSAWSAAIDSLAFGDEDPKAPKQLFLVSAGNADPFDLDGTYVYPGSNYQSAVEEPAQAWNAITVGAITHREKIMENDPESAILVPLALKGDLSPHSRTSVLWDPHWPIKPEIVMEGGNLGDHPTDGPERRDSLDLLTTAKRILGRPIAPFRATSAATALAAKLAAEISADYPTLWPETIRGLIVHSARWNDEMLNGLNPHRSGTSQDVQWLLRCFGYGEPNVARARASSQSEVTFFREDQFTPYKGSAGSASINDCHIHNLRFPAELLQALGETQCVMRVTLSYFTAPNPSASNRISGSRYRYGGCLLRFRVRHKDESNETFHALVAKAADEQDADQPDAESTHDPAWALGHNLRAKGGSLVHDLWRGSAVDLVTMKPIAVFPVKGWWALRSFPEGSPWHHCHKRSIRYSLIVSLEVMADVPLYTEISNLLAVPLDAV